MAWSIVASSAHATGQFLAGQNIWKVTEEGMASIGAYYELKVGKITGVTKPVLAFSDSRNSNGFQLGSGEYFNNIKPDGQLDGLALFASINELNGKSLANFIGDSSPINLWMDANGKLVATAPVGATGGMTIPITTGGTLVITAQPQYGTVALVSGSLQYTASTGYSGADSFNYEIKGASGESISTGTCSFSTSAASATAIPSFLKAVIDVAGDIRSNCVAGATVTLYKNGDSNIIATLTDSTNVGYILFPNVSRIQGDTFKPKAQKSGLSLSGFSIVSTTKRKPGAISGVTKQVAAGGSVLIAISELVSDSENAGLF